MESMPELRDWRCQSCGQRMGVTLDSAGRPICRPCLKGEPIRNVVPKINRNAPCPCGSGKKHKHCCLSKVKPCR